jgi:LPXTG-motif cell wall-anchored protein
MLLAIGLMAPGVAQAETLTGTFVGKGTGREVTFQHEGKTHNDWAGVLKLKIDNGPEVPVFCIQIQVRVRSGDRYRSDGPVLALPNGCQIRYLLDKYPASSAKSADEAAARQMAIWVFSDGVDPAKIEDASIRDRVVALVNEARQGPCPTRRTDAPNLTLTPPTANSAAGQTVAYTVQAGSEDAGHPATVSVAGPAVLTDANGAGNSQQQQVSLDGQGKANFWVTGTGPGAVTLRVDLPYKLEAGTVFSHLENGPQTQRLVMAEAHSLTASATGQLSVSGSAPQPTPTGAAEAPQPTPTGAAEAPQPSPTAATPPEQATATQVASAATATPPPPTRRPSHRTATPAPEQPAETVISETQATAVPTPPAETSATPAAAPVAGGQAPPVDQTTTAQVATAAPAGGAAQPRPSSLPNTGAADTPAGWLLMLIAGLLTLGGWLIKRRVRG